jgi:hypothetical protein
VSGTKDSDGDGAGGVVALDGTAPLGHRPKRIRFQLMAAVGLISLTAGAPGVRAIR